MMRKLPLLLLLLLAPVVIHAQCAGFPTTANLSLGLPTNGASSGWGDCLNSNTSTLDLILGGSATLAANSTTPSVAAHTTWITANTSPTTITNFTGGYPGQRIIVVSNDNNTTIAGDATIRVSATWLSSSSSAITFVLVGTTWTETGRYGNTGGISTYPGAGIAVSTGAAWGTSLTAPVGPIVGTTDTQVLTNKTVDGVSPTVFGYLDPTSSVQTQLNGKAPAAPTYVTADSTGSPPANYQTLVAGTNVTLTPSPVSHTLTVASSGGADTSAQYVVGAMDASLPNAAVNPHLYSSPDNVPASPTTYDDEFPGSSLDVKWTVFDAAAKMTETVANNRLVLASTDTTGHASGIYQAAPVSTPWAFTAKVIFTGIPSAYDLGGIAAFESATNKVAYVGFYVQGATYANWGYSVNHGTKGGAINTAVSTSYTNTQPLYMRIQDDGTNMNYFLSNDGFTFWKIYTELITVPFTTAPNQVGLVIGPYVNTFSMTVVWFRRTQ